MKYGSKPVHLTESFLCFPLLGFIAELHTPLPQIRCTNYTTTTKLRHIYETGQTSVVFSNTVKSVARNNVVVIVVVVSAPSE
jgi:hypothetical protein